MARPLLYLDVDGVLLRPDHSRWGFTVAPNAIEFISWAMDRSEPRWLTQRSQSGELEGVLRAFRLAGLPSASPGWSVLKRIPVAVWSSSKAEAIELRSEFWWLDDHPGEQSVTLLRQHGRLDRLITPRHGDPDALSHARQTLEQALDAR